MPELVCHPSRSSPSTRLTAPSASQPHPLRCAPPISLICFFCVLVICFRAFSYAVADGALVETMPTMAMRGKVTALAYSPDGTTLAAGDDQCQVMVWKVEDRSRIFPKWTWSRHGAKIACLAWSPDSARVASGSGDNHIFVWKPTEARGYMQIPRAHPEGVVDLAFETNDVLASVGRDAALRKWKLA